MICMEIIFFILLTTKLVYMFSRVLSTCNHTNAHKRVYTTIYHFVICKAYELLPLYFCNADYKKCVQAKLLRRELVDG